MNIREAITSGKRFRLPGWSVWYENQFGGVNKFSCADILREDWEVEEDKVEITVEITRESLLHLYKKLGIKE